MGEYQALTPDAEDAYGQLNYIFENGGAAVQCMLWPQGYDKGFNATMDAAIKRLAQNDRPRPGLTGGVGQVRPLTQGDQARNLVSLGTGPAHTGLIKSVGADGEWDGVVYTVPFHAHVAIDEIPWPATSGAAPVTLGPLAGLDSGSQIEVTFSARAEALDKATGDPAAANAPLLFRVLQDGQPLPGLSRTLTVGPDERPFRLILRVQLPTQPLTIELSQPDAGHVVRFSAPRVWRHTAQIAKPTRGIFTGQRHQGGVRFDVLPD
jgi:hypothetical protein